MCAPVSTLGDITQCTNSAATTWSPLCVLMKLHACTYVNVCIYETATCVHTYYNVGIDKNTTCMRTYVNVTVCIDELLHAWAHMLMCVLMNHYMCAHKC